MHTAPARWAAVLIIGIVVCVLALIAAQHGYSLRLDSRVIVVEMQPGSVPAIPPPPRLP